MLSTTPQFTAAYDRGYVLTAKPRVIVEWNHNRYDSEPTVINNVTYGTDETGVNAQEWDADTNLAYPLKSIIEPLRPERSGTVKARVGRAKTSRPGSPISYRVVGTSTPYKYWISPVPSAATLSGGGYAITHCRPRVMYAVKRWMNKITVGVENNYATPVTHKIQITTDGNNWITIANNPVVDADGRVTLYLQQNGTWSTDTERAYHTQIRGIRYEVTLVNRPSRSVGVIEISGRLEKNLSEITFEHSVDKALGEPDMIKPLGDMNSNAASVSFDNSTGLFDNDNVDSIYHGLTDKYAKISLYASVDTSRHGGPGFEAVAQGVFYSTSWVESADGVSVDVDATDYTEFLQNIQMPEVLYENRTAPDIIKDILVIHGFNLFENDSEESVTNNTMPFVWFDSETTVWDAIKSVAEADQGVGFFDEHGWFRYFSREYLHNKAAANGIDYKLRAIDNSEGLANIEEVDEDFNVQANFVKVRYKDVKRNEFEVIREASTKESTKSTTSGGYSEWGDAFVTRVSRSYKEPVYVPVWNPESSVTLLSSRLAASLHFEDAEMFIPAEDAKLWPFSGMANIQGETVSWEAKEYVYYDGNTGKQTVLVHDNNEYKNYVRRTDPANAHQSYFTGKLTGLKRGLYGTGIPVMHQINGAPWTDYGKWKHWDVNTGYYYHGRSSTALLKDKGTLQIAAAANVGYHSYTMIPHGTAADSYQGYGTTVIFRKNSRPHRSAGFFVNWDANAKTGYFFELNEQEFLTKYIGGAHLNVRAYMFYGNLLWAVNPVRGVELPITYDRPYQIEIRQSEETLEMYVDGQRFFGFHKGFLGTGTARHTGMWGPYVHGATAAEFDTIWTYNDEGGPTEAAARHGDESLFFNKITGGFSSSTDTRELYPHWYNYAHKWSRQHHWYYEEFVPIVHEVREFTVKHDPAPVLATELFSSNSDNSWLDKEGWIGPKSFIMFHESGPFRSKFVIANASRRNAILNGTDETVSVDGKIEQRLIVLGNNLLHGEDERVDEFSDEDAIRRRGKVELEFSNDWIQTEAQAKSVGEFIVKHWAEPVDQISVPGFFNPAIQLGDIVSVDFPDRNMHPETHIYAVNKMTTVVGSGIETNLELRRLR